MSVLFIARLLTMPCFFHLKRTPKTRGLIFGPRLGDDQMIGRLLDGDPPLQLASPTENETQGPPRVLQALLALVFSHRSPTSAIRTSAKLIRIPSKAYSSQLWLLVHLITLGPKCLAFRQIRGMKPDHQPGDQIKRCAFFATASYHFRKSIAMVAFIARSDKGLKSLFWWSAFITEAELFCSCCSSLPVYRLSRSWPRSRV